MTVKSTSRDAFYELAISGRATSQRERIMRYILFKANAGHCITRSMVHRYFQPFGEHKARDGGVTIPQASSTGRIADMVCDKPDCDHAGCDGYLMVDHYAPDPSGGGKTDVEWLRPIGDKWGQRRMF